MSIVKINAITIPPGMGETLEGRFAARADSMTGVDGFEGFQLLRPTAGEERYFVYTQWKDQASYDAWRNSEAFGAGHAGGRPGGPPPPAAQAGQGRPPEFASSENPSTQAKADGGIQGGPQADGDGDAPQRPVGMGADLLEFDVVLDVES